MSRRWESELSALQREELLAKIAALHPDRDPRELFGMMRWDLAEYERPHLPVLVGVLEDRASFGAQRGLRILDMAIRMPQRGWAIPDDYERFREVIALAVSHERAINPAFDDYYAYLTVDQKIVGPGQSQRRTGADESTSRRRMPGRSARSRRWRRCHPERDCRRPGTGR